MSLFLLPLICVIVDLMILTFLILLRHYAVCVPLALQSICGQKNGKASFY